MSRTFNGSTGTYLSSSALVVSAYPFTFACWCRTNDVTNRKTLFCLNDSTTNSNYQQVLIGGNVANDPVLAESGAFTATSTAGFSGSTGIWGHAAAVYASATDRRAFYNGGNKGTQTSSYPWPAATNQSTIGMFRGVGSFNPWNGDIAWACVWNVALSDEEIAALGTLGRAVHPSAIRPSAIVDLWECIESTGNEVPRIGTDTMTETGTVTVSESPLVSSWWPSVVTRSAPAAPAGGQPTMRRWGGVPGMALTGRGSW